MAQKLGKSAKFSIKVKLFIKFQKTSSKKSNRHHRTFPYSKVNTLDVFHLFFVGTAQFDFFDVHTDRVLFSAFWNNVQHYVIIQSSFPFESIPTLIKFGNILSNETPFLVFFRVNLVRFCLEY